MELDCVHSSPFEYHVRTGRKVANTLYSRVKATWIEINFHEFTIDSLGIWMRRLIEQIQSDSMEFHSCPGVTHIQWAQISALERYSLENSDSPLLSINLSMRPKRFDRKVIIRRNRRRLNQRRSMRCRMTMDCPAATDSRLRSINLLFSGECVDGVHERAMKNVDHRLYHVVSMRWQKENGNVRCAEEMRHEPERAGG